MNIKLHPLEFVSYMIKRTTDVHHAARNMYPYWIDRDCVGSMLWTLYALDIEV